MNKAALYKQLFGPLPSAELESVVERYPYFTPAHFYRLTHTAADHADFEPRLRMTALHFNNPHLLDFRLINDGEKATETPNMSQTSKNTETKAESDDALIFEPLHTTDYFASQGIKLGKEIKEDDKLGKQLKSFTDWLKTMKKLPASETRANIPLDKEVEKMAISSDMEVEVITESMAEVLIGQGKTDKAREVYHKLSLLNPDKKAYFAAKIDELKRK